MLKKLKSSKLFVLSLVVLCMTLNIVPIGNVYAASSELPTLSPQLFPYINEEDLKAKIINSQQFIQNHALFAHYLGFGWCGGTGSNLVGQDFEFRKDGDKYILQARYNPNDKYADGYWADKRLKMTISNVKFYIATETLKQGQEKVTELEPIVTQQYNAINKGDSEDTANTSFTYSKGKTVSHETSYNFEESVGVKHTASINVLFVGAQMEYGWSFKAGQAWSDSTSNVDNSTVTTTYNTTVPAQSKKTIKLMSYRTKSEVPYTTNIYMDYDITYSGFLRWGGNARSDHPQNRPFVDVTFGSGDLTAAEEIGNIYTNRSIPGYSNWDFGWMEKEFGADNVKYVVANIAKKPLGASISGKFMAVDGTHVEVVADKAVPLTPEELAGSSVMKSMSTPGVNMPIPAPSTGIVIDNFKSTNTPEVKPISTKITTNGVTKEYIE